MIWKEFILNGKRPTGKDKLNNITYEEFKVCKIKGRFTEWTSEEVNVLGREFTASNRKIVTPLTVDAIQGEKIEWNPFNFNEDADQEYTCTSVVADGVTYTINKIVDMGTRFRLLYVKGYKIP